MLATLHVLLQSISLLHCRFQENNENALSFVVHVHVHVCMNFESSFLSCTCTCNKPQGKLTGYIFR